MAEQYAAAAHQEAEKGARFIVIPNRLAADPPGATGA